MIENFTDPESWPILGRGHFSRKISFGPSAKTSFGPEKSFLGCFWPLGQDQKSGPLLPLRILLKKDVISRFLTFLMIFLATKAAKSWPESFFDWFGAKCWPSGGYWARIFTFENFWPVGQDLWDPSTSSYKMTLKSGIFHETRRWSKILPTLNLGQYLARGHF